MKRKLAAIITAAATAMSLCACGASAKSTNTYTVVICNYVDDASLNQIVDNIQGRLTISIPMRS